MACGRLWKRGCWGRSCQKEYGDSVSLKSCARTNTSCDGGSGFALGWTCKSLSVLAAHGSFGSKKGNKSFAMLRSSCWRLGFLNIERRVLFGSIHQVVGRTARIDFYGKKVFLSMNKILRQVGFLWAKIIRASHHCQCFAYLTPDKEVHRKRRLGYNGHARDTIK